MEAGKPPYRTFHHFHEDQSMSDTNTVERVKFANNIKLDGEAVDLDSIQGVKATGSVESIYKKVCEKVLALPRGKAFPVGLPQGATMEALKRAVLGYAAKHYEQLFKVKVGAGDVLYVYIADEKKPPKKAKKTKTPAAPSSEPAPQPPA